MSEKINIKLGSCGYGTSYTAFAYCGECGKLIIKKHFTYDRDHVAHNEKDARKVIEDRLQKDGINFCQGCGTNLFQEQQQEENDAAKDKKTVESQSAGRADGVLDEIFTEPEGKEYFRIKGNKTVYSLHPLKRQRLACALAKLYHMEHPEEEKSQLP